MTAPSRIGKIDILRQIGRGSMGIVYEGFDPLIARAVAVKVIQQDTFDPAQRSELLARLKREAQAAGRLNHPAIVSIYDFGEDATLSGGEVAYIAMELVEGRELKALFDAGQRFAPREVERIMLGLLGALQHAHERGVIHRDIKPANVIVLANGDVKVADFGVARIDSSELTQTGMVLGTPMYMAPEQMLGLAVDGRADLFAAGIMLYRLITGERPFTGSVTAVMQKVLNEPAEPPTRRNPQLVPTWDMVLDKALAKKREDRYQSAAEFAAAVRTATAVQDDDRTVLRPVVRPASTAPRWRWPAALAVGAGLALACVGWLSRNGEPAQRVAVAQATDVGAAAALVPGPTVKPAAATAGATADAAPVEGAPSPASAMVANPTATPPAEATAAAAPALTLPSKNAASAPKPKSSAPIENRARGTVAQVPRVSILSPPPVVNPTMPVPTAEELEWRAARLRLAAAKSPLGLADALTSLLDLRSTDERQRARDLEAWLSQRPGSTALALGAGAGYMQFAWRTGRPSPADVQVLVLQICRTLRPSEPVQTCRVVWTDGVLDRAALGQVADGLGERSLAIVRRGFLADVGNGLERLKAGTLVASPAAPPASPPASDLPSAAPITPPRPGWPEARDALRRDQGGNSLAKALGALLLVESPDDRQLLQQFEQMLQRLPWRSALVMGEQNGYLSYGYTWSESRDDWAADRARGLCNPHSTRPCVIVMADGKLIDAGLLEIAARVGARPPAVVREALLPRLRESVQFKR